MAEVTPQKTALVVEDETRDISADGYSYKLDICTGDTWGAGTDANVLVTIYGEDGDSGQRILSNSGNAFERDSTDTFKIVSSSYLGRIKKIIIGHDNSKHHSSWFLDKVTLEDVKSREVFEFPCKRWLAKDEDDGLTSRELLWSVVKVKEKEERANYSYSVSIYTGTVWGAGTDANVHITVYGTNSRSKKYKLKNKGKKTFESGMKDTCKIETKNPLGILYKVRIGHDNTGFGPGWFLDKIEIEDDITGEIVKFACGKWLSTTSDDGLICRDLMREGFVEEDQPSLETVTYTVNIFTGHKWGAGTDANVFLTLYGTDRDSPQQTIENKGSTTFENKMTDTYKFECPYLGTLTKIRIGHDNTGWGPAWYLDKVTVEDPKKGDVVVFPCYRWLATNADDGMIERELVRRDGWQVDGKKSKRDKKKEMEDREEAQLQEKVKEEKETQQKKTKERQESELLEEFLFFQQETTVMAKQDSEDNAHEKPIVEEMIQVADEGGTVMADAYDSLEKEWLEQDKKEEQEQFEKEKQEQLEKERQEKERQEKEKERLALLEKERQEKERQEQERLALLEKERQEKERQEQERLALLEKERQEKERQEQEREEQERLALLEKERQEKERQERERLALLEKERQEKVKEEKKKKEKEKKEKKKQEKQKQEREKQALLEHERQEREKQALLEKERQEREKQALLEKERQEREKQALLEKDLEQQEIKLTYQTYQKVNVPASIKSKALGMESGDIKDEQITASSHTNVTHPTWVRLNHPNSWCAGKLHDSWVQVDLETLHWVTVVATQGNPRGYKDYVKKLKIQHSQDGKNWDTYEENGNQIFDANVDNTTIKNIELQKAILSRYIRLCPLEWHIWPCMRMELYGSSPLTKA